MTCFIHRDSCLSLKMHHPTIVATLTAVLAALPAAQAAGLYTKSSPVLQVDGRSYDKLIAKSNYTSVRP